jgi:nicotinamidase-related amidase
VLVFAAILSATPADDARAGADEKDAAAVRPAVAGVLRLNLRERKASADGKSVEVVERTADWPAAKTAVIVIDVWDDHYCKSAARRVGVLAPRMNAVLTATRDNGVMIIHAPSDTINQYEGTPQRERMKRAPKADPPRPPIDKWCYRDPDREPELPVDVSKCACDDPVVGPEVQRHTRQHPAIDIAGYDGVSASGPEIYNFLVANGITNVVIMGVHTNMCILGRPFGIRSLVRQGLNVVLARDLTDAMYDPRQPPYVSHARGTEMVVEHVERYWCPTILGEDLTRVVAGSAESADTKSN